MLLPQVVVVDDTVVLIKGLLKFVSHLKVP
jgi:hypothetical protein